MGLSVAVVQIVTAERVSTPAQIGINLRVERGHFVATKYANEQRWLQCRKLSYCWALRFPKIWGSSVQ